MNRLFAQFRRPLLAGAFLVLALVLVYARALQGGFLWDDDLHVSANPVIVGPLGLKEIWTTSRANYFPLVLTNFWVVHALFGLNPLAYHVVSLGCHALAALLLWRVLLQLHVPAAWLGAALWALHPVQVESVAWICELKNTQSAGFFLAAVWCWLRWLDGKERFPWQALACAALALLSKPSTVMLPVALGLCTWWRHRQFDRRAWVALGPFFVLSALVAGWTIWEQRVHSGATGEEWNQTLFERAIIAGNALWFYLGKLVWPAQLSFIYPRWAPDASNLLAYLPVLLALTALAWGWRNRSRGGGAASWFAAGFFVALLFPVLGFFNVYFFRYSFVSDHFQYLASMAPLALLAAALARAAPRVLPAAGALLVLGFGAMSAAQTADYRDRETLWQATVARNPQSAMAWAQLGSERVRQGRTAEAVQCFDRAVAIQPRHPEAHNHLGCLHLAAGRRAEAIAELRQAVAGRRDFTEAQSNLGIALADDGQPAEAITYFEAALRLRPDAIDTRFHYAKALHATGRSAEALPYFARLLEQAPGRAEIHDACGLALAAAGRLPEAAAQHERALQLDPRRAEAHNHLGVVLAQSGDLSAALAHFDAAVQLEPAFVAAHVNRGGALAALRRVADAADAFRTAVRLDPDSARAHAYLAQLLRALGRDDEAREHFARAAQLESAAAPRRP